MRTSRMPAQPPKKKRKYTSFVIVAVVLGIAAYFIGAGAAGGWLAENVFEPVFNSSDANAEQTEEITTPDQQKTPETIDISQSAGNQVEENITAGKLSLYTLQVGAFSDSDNATEAATEVASKGGAGYVAYDGELYRVLIAGYTDKEDALSVKDNLAQTSVDSSLFILESGTLEFVIGAGENQINAIKECFNIVPATTESLQQIIYDADNGKDVSAEIETLQNNAAKVKQTLEDTVDIQDGALKKLHSFMTDFCSTLDELDASDVDFSSQLKYNLISIVVRYSTLLDDLSS